MADAVTSNVIVNNGSSYVVHLTNISDGTGESTVVKVDKSTLLDANGIEPASLDILGIRWNVQGFASVRLLWDHNTDDMALVLSGNGFDDFKALEPGASDSTQGRYLPDPRSTGGTGDIILTTNGAVSGATYDITLWLRKATA